MTSAEIRQSFLDFFAQRGHTIVPSSSLLPDSPGLLFTNAGMNQFVPIFLGERAPNVSQWAGARPATDTRAADTQKCIRAGGKHNDLEDVGFDTYHHTMFEMLGNWSFGDYFKMESLTWGWELLTQVWGIPPKRLFATVYQPGKGDPSEFDREAHDIWAGIFKKAGLDPKVHIVNGNKKDNFWQMGDTGPCGPCSEVHFNLLPSDAEAAGRALVNGSSPRCIEIWNHVFIQFNANADGSVSPLAARHIDTGMGFERVAGIHATTKGFKDFSAEPSNYNADVFKQLFDCVEKLSGGARCYAGTVPRSRGGLSEQEQVDVALRVLADHARCVSCAIADGILPGNDGRNYVIRRILRRGIMYGRKNLNLPVGFFENLVVPVIDSLGEVFNELKTQRVMVERAIRAEEESFGRTLDKGIERFDLAFFNAFNEAIFGTAARKLAVKITYRGFEAHSIKESEKPTSVFDLSDTKAIENLERLGVQRPQFSGKAAFELYDTYGFPLDMTQLLAAERGLTVDVAGFESEMEKQRERGRAAQKKDVIVAATEGEASAEATKFVGYDIDATTVIHARVVDVVVSGKDTWLVFDQTPFYAEMGGQVGDSGHALINETKVDIADCIKDKSGRHLHKLGGPSSGEAANFTIGSAVTLHVDFPRRRAINRHHSAAHLVHWALRKMLGTHVRQFGTHKTPDRLRFDFTHFEALTQAQIRECEQLVNEKVLDNSRVISSEIEYAKKPDDVLAFFGDKYGKFVRVVDIGGYSKELCGDTHVATTAEIGLIKITAEMAIAAGTRRIEAVAGQAAVRLVVDHETRLKAVGARLSAGPQDVVSKLDTLLAQKAAVEKQLKAFQQKAAANLADELAAQAVHRGDLRWVSAVVTAETPEALRSLGSQVLHKVGAGAVVQLGALLDGKVSLVAYCSPEAIKAGQAAGKLIGALAGRLGGKGGGKPDYAHGGGGDASKLAGALKI